MEGVRSSTQDLRSIVGLKKKSHLDLTDEAKISPVKSEYFIKKKKKLTEVIFKTNQQRVF